MGNDINMMGSGGNDAANSSAMNIPNLPSVPDFLPDLPQPAPREDDIDFDDLSKRFEELKKKK
jgi:hypothetical protein